jgi:hypothetical protein
MSVGVLSAQNGGGNAQQSEIGDPDPERVTGSPRESLKEVSVDKFEQDGFWQVYIPSDNGFALGRLFAGGPTPDKKGALQDEASLNISDNNVFGVKIDFIRRAYTNIYINAIRPIPIEGISKTVSVWVAGRNYNHRLYLIIEDSRGRYFEFLMGKMNFQGWKKMSVVIPPQNGDSNGIVQNDYHYTADTGIRVVGFRIDIDPMEAYGTYYLYLDDLRAVTDLFFEEDREADDPRDNW